LLRIFQHCSAVFIPILLSIIWKTPKAHAYEHSYQTKDFHLLQLYSQIIRNFWFYPDIFRVGISNLRGFLNNLISRIQLNRVRCSKFFHKIYHQILNLEVFSTNSILTKYISSHFPNIFYLHFSSEASFNHILGDDGYDEILSTIFDYTLLSYENLREKSSHQVNQILICVPGNKNEYKRLKDIQIS
jgi:hypothetical protein